MLKRISRPFLSLSLAFVMFVCVLPTGVRAVDEGMFLPDAISTLPLQELRRRGLQLTPDEIFNPNAPSLTDAMVQVGGGSGSFVSNEGLLLTNHHVAFDALVSASTPQNNYGETGYTARTRAEELPARNYRASITQSITDVTAQVLEGISDTLSATERSRSIAQRIAQLTQASAAQDEQAGLRTRIVPLNEGLRYYKFTSLVLRDVRIVYAPPKSIGYYGGDPDNFEWPRHCGDFAFMRAYVGPDGRPAAYSTNNVPFRPRRFLQISTDGVREGDFMMVMGHPASTRRYRESYSIAYNQEVTLPQQIAALRERLEALEAAGRRDPAARVRLQSQVFGISNTLKAEEGGLLALRRSDLVAERRAQEAEYTRWVNTDAGRRARYGEALPALARAYETLRQGGARDRIINDLATSDTLLTLAIIAAQAAAERDKPEAERSAAVLTLAQTVSSGVAGILPQLNAESGTAQLQRVFTQAAELPGAARLQILESRFGQMQPDARRRAEAEFARSLAADPTLLAAPNAAETIAGWYTMTTAQLRALNKPYLNFALEVLPESAAAAARTSEFNATVARYRPSLVAGMNEMRNGRLYPDANGTLRFTYGEVRGYQPRDATTYAPFTYLSGVFEKDTGSEPFNPPERLRQLFRARDFGTYAVQGGRDVPVDFLATTDIIGGNSGSPIMNGRGQMVGLVFDGNYEGLGNDFFFNPTLGRTIAVDVRYVFFITDKFANAGYILRELTVANRSGQQRRAA